MKMTLGAWLLVLGTMAVVSFTFGTLTAVLVRVVSQ